MRNTYEGRGAMKSRVRLGLVVVMVALLSSPALSATTLFYTGTWDQTFMDPKDQAIGLEPMDIQSVSRYFDGDFYYFQIQMYGDIGNATPLFADYYGIYIKNGPVDTSEEFWYAFSDYKAVLKENGTLALKNVSEVDKVIEGDVLQWKFKIDGKLPSDFSWWAVTQKGDNVNVADYAIAPIPNAAWLLGSGLVGLIGLRRRSRKQA